MRLGRDTTDYTLFQSFYSATASALNYYRIVIANAPGSVETRLYGDKFKVLCPISVPDLNCFQVESSVLTTTNFISMSIGRDQTNYNVAQLQFNYNALNTSTNSYGIGFYGFANLYTFSGVEAIFTLPLGIKNTSLFTTRISTAATLDYTFILPTTSGVLGQFLTSAAGSTLTWTTPIIYVSSVSCTVPSWLSVSGVPITTTGTIAITGTATGTGTNTVLSISPTITSATAATEALVLTNTDTNTAIVSSSEFAPNLSNAGILTKRFGVNTSSANNSMTINFNYTSSGAATNSFDMKIGSTNSFTMAVGLNTFSAAGAVGSYDSLFLAKPALAVSSAVNFYIGRDNTAYNRSIFRFFYSGLNSASNYVGLGFTSHVDLYTFSGSIATFTLPLTLTPTLAITSASTTNAFTTFNSGLTAAQSVYHKLGLSDTTGNSGQLMFTYQSSNAATNAITLQFTGGATGSLTIPNSLTGESIFTTKGLNNINSSTSVGGSTSFRTGQDMSNGNCGEVQFLYQGSNNSASSVSLGFWAFRALTIKNATDGTTTLLQNTLSLEQSGLASGTNCGFAMGTSASTGNQAQFLFQNNGSNAATNKIIITFYSGLSTLLSIPNTTSTNVTLNNGLEATSRTAIYYLSTNYSVSQFALNPVKDWTLYTSTGNNLLTYGNISGSWTNSTGSTISVTISYHTSLNVDTLAGCKTFIQHNFASSIKYGGSTVTQGDHMSGSATIVMANNDYFQIIGYSTSGTSQNFIGGSITTDTVCKVSYVINN
jgi:hypothetical protein